MIKKVGLIVILIVTIFNLIIPMKITYAAEPKKESINEVMSGVEDDSADSLMNDGKTTANSEAGKSKHKVSPEPSMGGATASALARLINIVPTLISTLLKSIVNSQQVDSSSAVEFTIQDLLAGKYDMFSIDFFGNVNETEKLNGKLTQNIVIWYSAMRNLAVGLTLLVLVYVGIRMSISTVADEKAKYQKMLIAWVKGFCLIFVLIYIVTFAINISNALVDLIPKSSDNLEKTLMYGNGTIQNPEEGSIMEKLATLKGWNYVAICVLYWVIVYYQLKFFILYFKRVLAVGLLTIISPLISITYPIDSIGDEKAQGFQRWLNEILINIFIQPLHLLIYTIFIAAAGAIATVAPLLAAFFLMGLSRGEKIIKNVLGIRSANSISSLGGIQIARFAHRA